MSRIKKMIQGSFTDHHIKRIIGKGKSFSKGPYQTHLKPCIGQMGLRAFEHSIRKFHSCTSHPFPQKCGGIYRPAATYVQKPCPGPVSHIQSFFGHSLE